MKKINEFLVLTVAMLVMIAGVVFVPVVSNAAVDKSESQSSKTTENNTNKKESSSDKKDESSNEKIPEGIKIDGSDVSGLTVSEASKKIDSNIKKYCSVTFKLTAQEKSIDASSSDLGIKAKNSDVAKRAAMYGKEGNPLHRYKANKDIESGKGKDFKISYTTNNATTAKFLEKNSFYINSKVKNNGLKLEGGKFTYCPGTKGTTVDVNESAVKIADYICKEWKGDNCQIELVYTETQPKGSQEELSEVRDVLGTYNTDFSSSAAGRAQNVKNGCSKINGTILYPGETFSVYDTVSPFEIENGYQLAGAYENGQTVESVGGGICQVSSTLYNAVLNSELEVVQRSNHTMIVTYVPPSQDAAIAGTYMDFKFKNNQSTPIYIDGYCSGGKIYFTIYGKETRDKNRQVKYESEVTEETEAGISFKYSDEMPAGSIKKEQDSHPGKKAKLWKIVTVNGAEQSRTQVNSSIYKPGDKIYTIGSFGITPEHKSLIDAAIATQDEEAVKAAVAGTGANNDGAQAPQ